MRTSKHCGGVFSTAPPLELICHCGRYFMTAFNESPDGDFYCDSRLHYWLLSCMWNFVFGKSAFLESGHACSSSYVHQFVNAPALSLRSPGRACEVTSQVSAKRRRHSTASPSFPCHGVVSLECPLDACHFACCSVGTINEIELKYVPRIAGHSYFSQGILLSKGARCVISTPKIGVGGVPCFSRTV